jgi:hypothetical protein
MLYAKLYFFYALVHVKFFVKQIKIQQSFLMNRNWFLLLCLFLDGQVWSCYCVYPAYRGSAWRWPLTSHWHSLGTAAYLTLSALLWRACIFYTYDTIDLVQFYMWAALHKLHLCSTIYSMSTCSVCVQHCIHCGCSTHDSSPLIWFYLCASLHRLNLCSIHDSKSTYSLLLVCSTAGLHLCSTQDIKS